MNRRKLAIVIAIVVIVILCILAAIFYGNSMYEWMLRVHHLR